MTISSNVRKAGPFDGTGSQTEFPFEFKVFSAGDLYVVQYNKVTEVETVLELDSDYTVTLNADQDNDPGGTIELTRALAVNYMLTITSSLTNLQPTDLTNRGGFYPSVINDALDRATIQIQQLNEQVSRSAKLPISSTQDADALVADLIRVADSADNLDTVANNIADVNTVSGNIANINQVASHMGEVTNFASVYQGGKATDPATRNDGTPLQSGDLYFNTTVDEMRAYTPAGWKSTVNYAATVQRFSGDGSTAAFNLSAAPLGENNTQVYISGIYQQKNTYDVSDATITFGSAPPVGTDNIEVVVFTSLISGATVDSANVQYTPAGTGASTRTAQSKLRESVSVKDFGAVGDGVANDKAAIEAAAASLPASGGILRIPAGTYYSPTGFLFSRSNITVIGEGMPSVSDDLTQLVGGTILQGTVLFDGDNITVENFGADHGIAYSNAKKGGAGGDGLVIHKVGLNAIRKNVNVRNVIGLTRIGDYNDPQAAFHAVLIESIRGGSADNVVGVGGWFGVVFKVADFNIGKVTGRENDAASVYLKSNSYGPVDRVNIDSVVVSNFVARGFAGLLIQSSDAELQAVTVGNVTVMGGMNAVRVEGEVSQPCVSVAIGNIATRNGSTGISVRGPVYGLTVGTASIWQPSDTGFLTAANTVGVQPVDVTIDTLRVVPSATSTKAVDIGSPGTKVVFGSVNAAAAGGNLIAGSIVNVQETTEIGQYYGTLNAGGSTFALVNGWAAAFAGQATGLIVKSGWTRGYGRLSAAAATSDTFMTIPSGMRPYSLDFFTTMTGYNGGTNKFELVTVKIGANGNAIMWPNRAAYAGLSWFSLTDLSFPTRIPAQVAI